MLNLLKLKKVFTLDVFSKADQTGDTPKQRVSNGQGTDAVDLIALQAIPPDFYKDDYDPIEYEFAHLPENLKATDVDDACEKRKRSLENSDQLSKGLGTVGNIENLLSSAARRAQSARRNLLSTGRDAHANLQVSLLNRRRLNLHMLKELAEKVAVILQTGVAIREHIEHRHLWLAVNELVLYQTYVQAEVISKLKMTRVLVAGGVEIKAELEREMDNVLEVVCVCFKEDDFASLLSTHIRLQSADFVDQVKRKFEYLLDSKLEVCFMQQQVAKMVRQQTSGAAEPNPFKQSLQQLCKRLKGAKFNVSVEQIMFNLFQILCSYHQMALNAAQELQHVQQALTAIHAGHVVRVNAVGLPVVLTADESMAGEAAPETHWRCESGATEPHDRHGAVPQDLGDVEGRGSACELQAPPTVRFTASAAGEAPVGDLPDRRPEAGPVGPRDEPLSPAASVGSPSRAEEHRQELLYYLTQRCSILSQLSDTMHLMRQATWIQVQSIVRDLYWSRQDIPGHMFSHLLQLGLKFSDMGLAFLNDDPMSGALGSATAELSATHDLEDIVVQRCGEYWFRSMHQGHLTLLLNDLLPGETWNITPYEIDGPTTPSLATALRAADTRNGPSIEQQSFEVWSNNPSAISKRARHVLLLHEEAQPRAAPAESDHQNLNATVAALQTHPSMPSNPEEDKDESASKSESQSASAHGTLERTAPASPAHRAPAVCVMATVHILRLWSQYGRLLPALKRSASLHIFVAIKGLFEEFMLYIVKNFAAIAPETVLRGLTGIDSKFFTVIKRMMDNAADPSDRRAMAAIVEAEKASVASTSSMSSMTGMSTVKKWTAGMGNIATTTAARPEEDSFSRSQRMGGNNLYGLFEGINACDALATLAHELRSAEPLLKKYQRDGDETLHAKIQELYDKEGSLNEVTELRRRCVRGSVERKLDNMKQETMAALNKACYNVKGSLQDMIGARREWVDNCKLLFKTFAIQLSSCQDKNGIKEVWQEAIKIVNDVVLDGLAICLTDRTAMDKLLTAGAAARRGLSPAGCQWIQDDIVRLSSALSDLLRSYAPAGIREEAMSLFTAIEWVWGAGGAWKPEAKDQWERWICKSCGIVRPERVIALFQARINMEGSKNSAWTKDLMAVAQAFL